MLQKGRKLSSQKSFEPGSTIPDINQILGDNMSAILDASSDLYFFVSRSGTIDYFNKAWEHSINQYCEVEVNPGMHLRDFLPFDRWEKWIPYIEKGLNGEGSITGAS